MVDHAAGPVIGNKEDLFNSGIDNACQAHGTGLNRAVQYQAPVALPRIS